MPTVERDQSRGLGPEEPAAAGESIAQMVDRAVLDQRWFALEVNARHEKALARMLPWPFWQTGQRGRVTGGPLSGVEGIVVNVKEPVRLVLSISLLRRSVLVEIDAACVSL